jgi:RNA polymerase-binding transcription factor DksA
MIELQLNEQELEQIKKALAERRKKLLNSINSNNLHFTLADELKAELKALVSIITTIAIKEGKI